MQRTASRLLDANAMVRQVEYLGTKKLPYRMRHKESYVYSGRYGDLPDTWARTDLVTVCL